MSQKKFCNYCKGSGHLIAECKRCPQNRPQRVYYSGLGASETLPHSTDAGSSLMASTPQSIVPVPPVVSSTTGSEFLKLSDAQALIQNALAGLGISANKSSSSSCRYLDSGATNHMAKDSQYFSSLKPYVGDTAVHTTNGDRLPISGLGNMHISSHPPLNLKNAFFVPALSTN